MDIPGSEIDSLAHSQKKRRSKDEKNCENYFKTLLNGTDSQDKVNPLFIPNAVIIVVDGKKRDVDIEFYQKFLDSCKERSIHPILVYTRGTPGEPMNREPQNFGIHNSHVFVIDCYDTTKKGLQRNTKTDAAVLDILHAAHIESEMHMDSSKKLEQEYKFPFIPLTDSPETLCVSCGFSANTFIRGDYYDSSKPIMFNVYGEWKNEIMLKDLDFSFETDEDGNFVKITIRIYLNSYFCLLPLVFYFTLFLLKT